MPAPVNRLSKAPSSKQPILPGSVEIRGSKVHGYGVFARIDIPKGIRLIEYVGEKITKKESQRRAHIQYEKSQKKGHGAVYIFEINKRYDIDGNVSWNPARLINHSCSPNCEVEQEGNRIWIHSKRRIKAGEELTYDYGYDLEAFEEHPCLCGSGNCIGYIVRRDQWPKLKRLLNKKKITK